MKRSGIDTVIVWLLAVAVIGYMVLTYTTSYQHIYILGLATGQSGTDARLTPLTVALPLLVLSLAVLFANRKRVRVPRWLWASLWAAVVADVAGNWYFGGKWGIVGALMSAVPAAFLALVIEAAMFVLRVAAEAKEAEDAEAEELLKDTQEAAQRERNVERGKRAAATRKARQQASNVLNGDMPAALPPVSESPDPTVPVLTGIGLSDGNR